MDNEQRAAMAASLLETGRLAIDAFTFTQNMAVGIIRHLLEKGDAPESIRRTLQTIDEQNDKTLLSDAGRSSAQAAMASLYAALRSLPDEPDNPRMR